MERMTRLRHPWLLLLPGLAVLYTLVADFAYGATGEEIWWLSARPVLAIGLAGMLVAFVAGILDQRAEPEDHARWVAGAYVGLDLIALLSLGTMTWLRFVMPVPTDPTPGVAWSILTLILVAGSGWLGRRLVQVHPGEEPTGRA